MPHVTRYRNVLLWTLLTAALLCWGWFDVRRRGRIEPDNPATHKTDFTIYTTAGAAMLEGRDPYAVRNVRGWEYLYPPLLALLVAPLHGLPPQDQVFIWFVVSAIAAAVGVWACRVISLAAWRAAGGPANPPGWVGPLALLAGLLPLLNSLQRGQVGAMLLFLLVLGLRGAVLGVRPLAIVVGGGLLATAIVIKLTPALPVAALAAFLVLATPRRGALVAAGIALGLALGFVLVPAVVIGWDANLRHLWRWWTIVATNPNLAADTRLVLDSVRNQSVENALRLAFGPECAPAAIRWPIYAVVAALLGVVVVRARGVSMPLAASAVFGLGGVAALLISPVSWGHHYFLMMPAVAFVALALLRGGRPRAAVVLSITPVVLTIGHYGFLESLGRSGWLGLGTLGWYLAAAGWLSLRQRSA